MVVLVRGDAEVARWPLAECAGPDLVVLSGGNPALLDLAELIAELKRGGLRVAVETAP